MTMPLEDLARIQVYSASRHFEDARKAPSSVSIITAEMGTALRERLNLETELRT